MTVHGIILAAGSGSRFGDTIPKQYACVLGKPVYTYAVSVLQQITDTLLLVCNSDIPDRDIRTVPGGATRSASLRSGMHAIAQSAHDDDWVLVHDAARPCLHRNDCTALLSAVRNDAVGGYLATPVVDTLRGNTAAGLHTYDRNTVHHAATPQLFRYGILTAALAAHDADYADEAEYIVRAGYTPKIVTGRYANPKLTYPEDRIVCEALLTARHKAGM